MSSAEVIERQAARWAALERAEQPRNLAAYFDAAVARHAGRPLWVQSEQSGATLTYAELAAWVHRCAATLQAQGVGRGTRVAVMLPNLPAFAITWMAIARLGAVIVPVNTHYTARELAYTLDQGEVELLVIAGEYLNVLEQIPAADLRLSSRRVIVHGGARSRFQLDWHRLLATAPAGPPAHDDPDADDPVSILFTSGSTGLPK